MSELLSFSVFLSVELALLVSLANNIRSLSGRRFRATLPLHPVLFDFFLNSTVKTYDISHSFGSGHGRVQQNTTTFSRDIRSFLIPSAIQVVLVSKNVVRLAAKPYIISPKSVKASTNIKGGVDLGLKRLYPGSAKFR